MGLKGLSQHVMVIGNKRAGAAISKVLCQVKELEGWRGDRCVFSQLSFTLKAGEVLLVLGENGAGKTSLLRALAGLLSVEGTITLSEPSCLYIGHHFPRYSTFTVLETLQFYASLLPQKDQNLPPSEALKHLKLERYQESPVKNLSEGQKKRLKLSHLILQKAPLWLLDEPTHALDQAGLQTLKTWLAKHLENKGGAIIATHQEEWWQEFNPTKITLHPLSLKEIESHAKSFLKA